MEVALLMREIQAVIWRNFGVDRLAMGAAQDINRSTAEAMVATRHYSLFKPILDLWANKFTYEILSEINPNLYIEFIHYARTGDDADLQDEGGQGEPIGAPTGHKVDKDKKACFTCKGDGWINYKDEGTRITDQCPSCHGRGRVGPLFVSRPHRARVIIPVEPQSQLAPTDPDIAWASFGDPRQRARLDDEVLKVQERLAERLESVESYDDLVSVGRFVRNQLMSLYDMAYDLGSKVVTSAGRKPNPRPLREARCAIMEVVRFELQETAASVLKLYTDPGNDGVNATAERALVSASHLASFAPRLAGQVIACQFE
jgi:hypothetical protein